MNRARITLPQLKIVKLCFNGRDVAFELSQSESSCVNVVAEGHASNLREIDDSLHRLVTGRAFCREGSVRYFRVANSNAYEVSESRYMSTEA